MKVIELVEQAKLLGAKVKEIRRHCKHQQIATDVFGYCRCQQEFGLNLGSAGGPAIQCEGYRYCTSSHKETTPDSQEITVLDYSEPKTCEFYVERGNVLGWELTLSNIEETKEET